MWTCYSVCSHFKCASTPLKCSCLSTLTFNVFDQRKINFPGNLLEQLHRPHVLYILDCSLFEFLIICHMNIDIFISFLFFHLYLCCHLIIISKRTPTAHLCTTNHLILCHFIHFRVVVNTRVVVILIEFVILPSHSAFCRLCIHEQL